VPDRITYNLQVIQAFPCILKSSLHIFWKRENP
jgi:hypothetical protein